MKMSSIIVTTIFVGAASIVAGTLFASGKGEVTRRKIARKTKLYKDYLMDNIYDFTESISHPNEDLEEETLRLSKKANAKAKKIRDEISQRVNG